MFYEPSLGHGLKYNPFKAIVAPRPIGWISTLGRDGVPNLAPYSFFSALANIPPMVSFTSEGMKDTPINAIASGEFVCNLSTLALAEQMNLSSAILASWVDEFGYAGLTAAPCTIVKAPRVAESPASLECKVTDSFELKDLSGRPIGRHLVIGEVVGVHIDDDYLVDGLFDSERAAALGRCGYRDYAIARGLFEMPAPPLPPEELGRSE